MGSQSWKLGMILLIFQVIFLVLFAVFGVYDHDADAHYEKNQKDPPAGNDPDNNSLKKLYPMFQDVHVMIFIGFGFLMTFLKRYGFGAVGINFLLAAFVLEWAMIFGGLLHLHEDGKFHISIGSLLVADFAAAAVLITFGALIGKVSPLQLIVIAFIEIIIFSGNEKLGLSVFQAVDVGGSMFVHAFGAYFGLAISRVLYRKDTYESSKEGSVYHSDMFAMIGTIFLWLYWPSFNAALAPGDDQHRAVINTYLALAACCVTAFAVSHLVGKGKFDMVHVQNSTLAGGVAVGTSADMMINPWGAILIGMLAGTLSVIGYKYITPFINDKLKAHDTCGVNNLHGMPGVLAGICGAIVTSLATEETYGNALYQLYPARAPLNNTDALKEIQKYMEDVEPGLGRSAGEQAGYQAAALAVTLLVAVVGGALTGLLLKIDIWEMPKGRHIFDDGPFWECPEDFEEGEHAHHTLLDGKSKEDEERV